MTRVALTGGIATGKSHVRATFAHLGVPTIDADDLARAAVEPGTAALSAIVERFGPDMLDGTGHLDRKRLATVVFADGSARRDLEAILHPIVRAGIEAWFAAQPPGTELAMAVVPLLYESGLEANYDAVVTTSCADDAQLRRLMDRDRVSEAEARRRIEAQLADAERVARADYVISTDGTIADTERRVGDVLDALRAR